jgi:hypothetical protein
VSGKQTIKFRNHVITSRFIKVYVISALRDHREGII